MSWTTVDVPISIHAVMVCYILPISARICHGYIQHIEYCPFSIHVVMGTMNNTYCCHGHESPGRYCHFNSCCHGHGKYAISVQVTMDTECPFRLYLSWTGSVLKYCFKCCFPNVASQVFQEIFASEMYFEMLLPKYLLRNVCFEMLLQMLLLNVAFQNVADICFRNVSNATWNLWQIVNCCFFLINVD
jgi:hypothetical protein